MFMIAHKFLNFFQFCKEHAKKFSTLRYPYILQNYIFHITFTLKWYSFCSVTNILMTKIFAVKFSSIKKYCKMGADGGRAAKNCQFLGH